MIVLTVLLTIFGLAILTTGALAFTGKLPGNSFVGLHIPEASYPRSECSMILRRDER
ncbi:MAG TPA: hypothetical protein H9867_02805 [Candidatus Corynebacterium gallistercoris]|uniref:Uncharacterized protein n=1 Tax=Candidatus Corynebacterium gallistercoris TaxID=2838530 RepID=A0A9D1RY37_9CORY|nr:hypothetical protein [Candidatus Corynebacterium gallistercoris]